MFATFYARNNGHVFLGNNYACSLEGTGIVHWSLDDVNELILDNVFYVDGIKNSILSVGQMGMQGHNSAFEKGSWNLLKGLVKGTKEYC